MRWQPTAMTGRRIAWLGIAILAGVWMLFLHPLERDPGVWAPRTSLRLTSDQVMTLLGRNAIGLGGMGGFSAGQALTNRSHLELHARLLAGQKFHRLQTTHASLGDVAVALSHYANREVRALVEPEEAGSLRFGPFDSETHATRWSAANALQALLGRNGWHILRTADGMLLLVSEGDRTTLLAQPSPVSLPVPPGLPPAQHPPSRSAATAPDGARQPD